MIELRELTELKKLFKSLAAGAVLITWPVTAPRKIKTQTNMIIPIINVAKPIIIPAIAMPRPPWPVFLIWLKAIKPKIIAKTLRPNKPVISEAIARPLVPTAAGCPAPAGWFEC